MVRPWGLLVGERRWKFLVGAIRSLFAAFFGAFPNIWLESLCNVYEADAHRQDRLFLDFPNLIPDFFHFPNHVLDFRLAVEGDKMRPLHLVNICDFEQAVELGEENITNQRTSAAFFAEGLGTFGLGRIWSASLASLYKTLTDHFPSTTADRTKIILFQTLTCQG